MALKENLKFLREQKNMSQAELAEALGKGQATIQKIESGRTDLPRFLDKIAQFFEVSEEMLLFGDLTSQQITSPSSGLKQEDNSLQDEMMSIRIIEERARLGYSQKDFAEKIQININKLQDYELGKQSIPVTLLAALAANGLDIQYILTGKKNQSASGSNLNMATTGINQGSIRQINGR